MEKKAIIIRLLCVDLSHVFNWKRWVRRISMLLLNKNEKNKEWNS